MVKYHRRGKMPEISYKDLSNALDRSEAFIRIASKTLDIDAKGECISFDDVLVLMRYFAGHKSEQDVLWQKQNSKFQALKSRNFEYAVALDIVKRERSFLKQQVGLLTEQLTRAHERSDRLENKLHDLTESLSFLVSQRDRLVAQKRIESLASIKYHNGREVLYLECPVNLHLLGRVRH